MDPVHMIFDLERDFSEDEMASAEAAQHARDATWMATSERLIEPLLTGY